MCVCFLLCLRRKQGIITFIDRVWRGGKDYLCVFVCDWEEGGEDLDENSDESAYWPPQVSQLSWKLEFPMKSQLFLFYCSQSQGVTIVTSCHFYNVAAEVSNLWKTTKNTTWLVIQIFTWYVCIITGPSKLCKSFFLLRITCLHEKVKFVKSGKRAKESFCASNEQGSKPSCFEKFLLDWQR